MGDKCRVYKDPCPEHDFIHGAEAEELREGIEGLIKRYVGEDFEEWEMRDLLGNLQELLDRVDARDSLAFREAADREDEPDPAEELTRLREEVAHLRQGIDLFRGAYLTATSVRPTAKRVDIEGWLAEDRRRTGTEIQTLRPDYPWGDC